MSWTIGRVLWPMFMKSQKNLIFRGQWMSIANCPRNLQDP
jgi:hypothetical protein